MASNIPTSSVGLTLQTSGGAPKVLNNAEANQILQRLRAAGAKVGDNQTIKIQAIQTNPNTGVRQIVAIPIQSSGSSPAAATTVVNTGARLSSGSPMKVIRLPAGAITSGATAGGTQIVTMSPAQLASASGGELPANVKVVKIPAGAASTIQSIGSSPASAITLGSSPANIAIRQNTVIRQQPQAQVLF